MSQQNGRGAPVTERVQSAGLCDLCGQHAERRPKKNVIGTWHTGGVSLCRECFGHVASVSYYRHYGAPHPRPAPSFIYFMRDGSRRWKPVRQDQLGPYDS
jgi:hypothetical protein